MTNIVPSAIWWRAVLWLSYVVVVAVSTGLCVIYFASFEQAFYESLGLIGSVTGIVGTGLALEAVIAANTTQQLVTKTVLQIKNDYRRHAVDHCVTHLKLAIAAVENGHFSEAAFRLGEVQELLVTIERLFADSPETWKKHREVVEARVLVFQDLASTKDPTELNNKRLKWEGKPLKAWRKSANSLKRDLASQVGMFSGSQTP